MWLLVIALVVLLFGFVVAFGAPYLPTLQKQKKDALDLLDLKPGQTLLELGCGDGRVVRAAAQRGWQVVGYELNPILVLGAIVMTWPYRKQVKIVWGNYWRRDWPEADGVFVFLLDRYMTKLDTKITRQKQIWKRPKPVRLVSYTFKMPGREPDSTKGGLYLYKI